MKRLQTISALLTVLTLLSSGVRADGYTTEWSHEHIANDKAQLIFAGNPALKIIDPWYAFGDESYYKSPGCVVYRELYIFSKPRKSSPGVWRGKRAQFEQTSNDETQKTCNDMHLDMGRELDTASFIDPDKMRPDESESGLLPGVFLTDPKVTDDELLVLSRTIPQILTCLKKNQSCGYEIEQERTDLAPSYMRLPALKVEKLESIFNSYDERGVPHYEIRFAMQHGYPYQVILDIFHKGDTVTKVVLTGPMLYIG